MPLAKTEKMAHFEPSFPDSRGMGRVSHEVFSLFKGGGAICTPPQNTNKNNRIPTPLSLRLTFEECATLEQSASSQPLRADIRSKLFGGKKQLRRKRTRTKNR